MLLKKHVKVGLVLLLNLEGVSEMWMLLTAATNTELHFSLLMSGTSGIENQYCNKNLRKFPKFW